MLEMSGRLAVLRTDGPTILVEPDVALAHGNHRFDGYTHGGFQHHAISTTSVVRHLGILMHLTANAMSGQFADDAVAMSLAVFLHSTADITEVTTSDGIVDTLIQGLLRGTEQLFDLFADLANTERVAGVAAKAVEQRAAVDGDDVTVLKHCLSIGDAMHDDVVY